MEIEPTKVQISEQLDRIVKSDEFKSSPRQIRFLRYIVEKTLNGEQKQLKGYAIGVDVYDRGERFDPQSDTIVRVQARILRRSLEMYYHNDGRNDPIQIDVPKGGYVPKFSFINAAAPSKDPKNFANGQNVSTNDIGAPNAGAGKLKRPQRDKWIFGLILGAITVAVIVFIIMRQATLQNEFNQAMRLPTGPSVAILPFDIVGPETEQEEPLDLGHFSTGLQAELVGKISRFKGLLIKGISAKYLEELKESEDTIGTQYLLSGTIQRSGEILRITSILSQTSTGEIVWTRTYDEDLGRALTLLEIQSKIAVNVAGSLGQPSGSLNRKFVEENSKMKGLKLDHYYCLMRFYDYENEKSEKEHFEIRECLERAVEAAPNFSSGWAALSRIHLEEFLNKFNLRNDQDPATQRAVEAARRGVAADPDNAMAHQYLALAKFVSGDHRGFFESANIALKLNPNDAEMLAVVGNSLILVDKPDKGLPLVNKAIELNPGHPPWYHTSLAAYYYQTNDFEKALYHAHEYKLGNSLASHVLYTAVLADAGEIEEARAAYNVMVNKYPFFPENYQQIMDERPMPAGFYSKVVSDLSRVGLKTTNDVVLED